MRMWDAASGAQLAVLQGHSDAVSCITVSSDGRFAATASYDGTSACGISLPSVSVPGSKDMSLVCTQRSLYKLSVSFEWAVVFH